MALTKWKKVASVSRGGKPYFYLARDGKGTKLDICWNRIHEKWELDRDDKRVALFDSATAAEKYAQKNYEVHSW